MTSYSALRITELVAKQPTLLIFSHRFHVLDCIWPDPAQQLPGKHGRISSCVRLPHVVLVRVRIVRDAANDQTFSVDVDARGFYLDTERPITSCANPISQLAVLDD